MSEATVTAPVESDERWYHLTIRHKRHPGNTPGGLLPFMSKVFKGLSWREHTTLYEEDGTARSMRGGYVRTTPERIAAALAASERFVVRWMASSPTRLNPIVRLRSAQVFCRDAKGFRPMRGDEPLRPYLTAEPMPEGFDPRGLHRLDQNHDVSAEMQRYLERARESEAEHRKDPKDAATRRRHAAEKAQQ